MLNRKIVASASAVVLATGLVACSNDETGTAEVTETAVETNTATETVAEATETLENTATETATSSAADSTDGSATAAAGEGADATTELALANGETALVPQGVADAVDEFGEDSWGEPTAVEEVEGGWVVTFDGEHYVAWSENTGGAPIWGEIANSWLNDVRDARVLGFPLAAETPNTDGSGWNQEFENGTIEWRRDGSADAAFRAFVEENNK